MQIVAAEDYTVAKAGEFWWEVSAMNVSIAKMAAVLLTACLLAGCDTQYATRLRLTQQSAEITSETADLLASVQDRASAGAAAPKLEALRQRMAQLDDQFSAMDTEDEIYLGEENETILAEHGKWIAAQTRLMQEQQRIGANQEVREALGQTWIDLTGGMYDPGGPLAAGGEMDLGATRQVRPGVIPGGAPSTPRN